jgi:hypothetical protein
MTAPILLVRPRRGSIGESHRVVHIVPLNDPRTVPEVLRTYCGARLPLATVDLLGRPCGMPCTMCLATAPIPPTGELPRRSGTTPLPPRRGTPTAGDARDAACPGVAAPNSRLRRRRSTQTRGSDPARCVAAEANVPASAR